MSAISLYPIAPLFEDAREKIKKELADPEFPGLKNLVAGRIDFQVEVNKEKFKFERKITQLSAISPYIDEMINITAANRQFKDLLWFKIIVYMKSRENKFYTLSISHEFRTPNIDDVIKAESLAEDPSQKWFLHGFIGDRPILDEKGDFVLSNNTLSIE